MNRIAHLILAIVFFFVLSSCEKEQIKISPESITVGSQGQTVVFLTNTEIYSTAITMYTDSKEPIETIIWNFYHDWTGDWFRLHMESKGIKLELDENTGADRQLEFAVYHNRSHAIATVTQLGAASLE